MTNILEYLDREIENFKIRTGDYPNLILMSKETKDKIFDELELEKEPEINNSWENRNDNYRGIPIEIKKDIFLELKGD